MYRFHKSWSDFQPDVPVRPDRREILVDGFLFTAEMLVAGLVATVVLWALLVAVLIALS